VAVAAGGAVVRAVRGTGKRVGCSQRPGANAVCVVLVAWSGVKAAARRRGG